MLEKAGLIDDENRTRLGERLDHVVAYHIAQSIRWIPDRSATGLSEADPDVSAKLAEQRLERGEEAEALPRRQVVGEDDLLQLGVAERVEVEVAR